MGLFSPLTRAAQGGGPRRLQRACACAGQGKCAECEKKKRVQRKAADASSAPASVSSAFDTSGGAALAAPLRSRLEPLFGTDFSGVRIHDDARSHADASRLRAQAFTVGQHVHFGRGLFRPDDSAGLHLLAHELAHTVQQRGASAGPPELVDAPDSPLEREADAAASQVLRGVSAGQGSRAAAPRVQRSIGEFFSRLFGEGTFDDRELLAYLRYLDDHAAIEGSFDSDNKARAVIRRWRAGEAAFVPSLPQKQLMLLEMIDGPTLDDDEHAILELLRGSSDAEVTTLLATAGGEQALRDEFQGSESDELDALLASRNADPRHRPVEARERGTRAARIAEIVVNQDTPQTVTLRYVDGRIEADTCSAGKGTCCVDPGSDAAPSASQTQQTDSNWTPTGSSAVQFKRPEHHNIRWWTQFNSRGIALHAYAPVDGTPLSHGCVRLHEGFAERVYQGAQPGSTVVRVIGSARPRCDHGPLVAEWMHDFDGAQSADAEDGAETRRHLRLSFGGVGDAELERRIAAREIPRCATRRRP